MHSGACGKVAENEVSANRGHGILILSGAKPAATNILLYLGAAIAKVFVEIRRKESISHIFWSFRRVREVESCAPSKSQPPTTLGDPQNVEKTVRQKFDFFRSQESVF